MAGKVGQPLSPSSTGLRRWRPYIKYVLVLIVIIILSCIVVNHVVDMSKIEISSISEPLDVGTRIHWDEKTESVYFVDVPNSVVYKYDTKTQQTTKAKVANEPLAFMFPVEGSETKFIAGLGRKFVFVEWDGNSPNVSNVDDILEIETESHQKGNRLNGAKVDPYGRLWAGTMGPNDVTGDIIPDKGSLYSLERGILKKHDENIGCSNGLAWNTKENKMYYIDTLVPGVFQYEFSNNGTISDRKQIFNFEEQGIQGLPDGLVIDSEDQLWVCAIYGSVLVRFNPKDGKVLKKIEFPTPQITSAIFGGEKLDKLFVTTARIPVKGEIPPAPAGTTYIVENTGYTGTLGNRYKP